MIARSSRPCAAFAFAAFVALSGTTGCGGADRDVGDASTEAKADAVEVTYYYLPG